jgi:amino acid permease
VIFSSTTNILNESEKENTLASKTVSIMCIILCCAYATYIDKTFMHTFHMCIHQLCFLWDCNCCTAFPQHRSLALIKER